MHRVILNDRFPAAPARNGGNAVVWGCGYRRRFGPGVAEPQGFAVGGSHSGRKGGQGTWRLSPHVAGRNDFQSCCRRVDGRAFFLEHTHGSGSSGQDPRQCMGCFDHNGVSNGFGNEVGSEINQNIRSGLVFRTDRPKVPIFANSGAYDDNVAGCGLRSNRLAAGDNRAIRQVSYDPVVPGKQNRPCKSRKYIGQGYRRIYPTHLQTRHGGSRQLSQQNQLKLRAPNPSGMSPFERI